MRAQLKYIALSIVCGLLWPWNAFWDWVCYVSPEEDRALQGRFSRAMKSVENQVSLMSDASLVDALIRANIPRELFRRDLWRMMAGWTTHFRQERIVARYNLYFPNSAGR